MSVSRGDARSARELLSRRDLPSFLPSVPDPRRLRRGPCVRLTFPQPHPRVTGLVPTSSSPLLSLRDAGVPKRFSTRRLPLDPSPSDGSGERRGGAGSCPPRRGEGGGGSGSDACTAEREVRGSGVGFPSRPQNGAVPGGAEAGDAVPGPSGLRGPRRRRQRRRGGGGPAAPPTGRSGRQARASPATGTRAAGRVEPCDVRPRSVRGTFERCEGPRTGPSARRLEPEGQGRPRRIQRSRLRVRAPLRPSRPGPRALVGRPFPRLASTGAAPRRRSRGSRTPGRGLSFALRPRKQTESRGRRARAPRGTRGSRETGTGPGPRRASRAEDVPLRRAAARAGPGPGVRQGPPPRPSAGLSRSLSRSLGRFLARGLQGPLKSRRGPRGSGGGARGAGGARISRSHEGYAPGPAPGPRHGVGVRRVFVHARRLRAVHPPGKCEGSAVLWRGRVGRSEGWVADPPPPLEVALGGASLLRPFRTRGADPSYF